MKLRLFLQAREGSSIPLNYQYPLSAAIYKILSRADAEYATFLHDIGYKQANSLKAFKLFAFSDIKTPFRINGDRMQLLTRNAEFEISFHLPQATETFVKGIFLDQRLEIADKRSRISFAIDRVEALPTYPTCDGFQELMLHPLSPIVCGKKNEKKNYDFLSPDHPEFISQLMYNWKEKYTALYGNQQTEADFADAGMEVIFYKNPPRSRLITIKAGTVAETKIRGWMGFALQVRGRKEAVSLMLDAGCGLYNSTMGGGYMEIVNCNQYIHEKGLFQVKL